MSQSSDFHSIIFTKNSVTKNTWNDFHLIPSSRPDIAIPARAFKYVDIPGRVGSLDLTDYLTGAPSYSDRSGTFEFVVIKEYDGQIIDNRSWIARKNELLSFFDGSQMRVRLEDDNTHYYIGRVTMEAWTTGEAFSTASLNYRLSPVKYNLNETEAGI